MSYVAGIIHSSLQYDDPSLRREGDGFTLERIQTFSAMERRAALNYSSSRSLSYSIERRLNALPSNLQSDESGDEVLSNRQLGETECHFDRGSRKLLA